MITILDQGIGDSYLIGKAKDILFEHEIQQYQLKPNELYLVRLSKSDKAQIIGITKIAGNSIKIV